MKPVPRKRPATSISARVILSMVLVILLQGAISMAVVLYLLSSAAAANLDDQLRRTPWLIENYLEEHARTLELKAGFLAAQEELATESGIRGPGLNNYQMRAVLAPLRLDAGFVVNANFTVLARGGNKEALDIALGNQIFLSAGKEAGIVLAGQVSKIQMWAYSPIRRNNTIQGYVFVCSNLDRAFMGGMEEAGNTLVLLTLKESIMVNGHLSDPVFLEYSRRTMANPREETGRIQDLVYRMVRFRQHPELAAVYFFDTEPARSLMTRYTTIGASTLLVSLLLGVGMAVAMYRFSFQKPFKRFQEAIRSLSRGELSFQAAGTMGNEFTELEHEFEAMTRNLKSLEDELRISSRMAAVGEMVAGVAHQIRNPLGIMKVSAGLLSDMRCADPAEQDQHQRLVAMIAGEIQGLETIISRFLDVTRPLQIHKLTFPLKPWLLEVIAHHAMSARPALVFDCDCPPDLAVSADPVMFRQVLDNLLINAADACPEGGRVHIGAATGDDGRCHLTVSDTGHGMDPEVCARIFHPFFTTRSTGTGLGLSIAHRIMEAHGGTIQAESSTGKGTVFKIVV